MVFTGEVIALRDDEVDPTRGVVDVSIAGANAMGNHVVGTVSLTLPKQEV